MSLLEILEKGGVLMVAIGACSLIALAVVIERWWNLRKLQINTATFILQIKNLLLKDHVEEAIALCKRTPGPIAKITKAAIEKRGGSREEIREAIEDAGKIEVYQLEKNLNALGTVAAVSPLIGFLGTVTGMIRAFMQIQVHGGNVDASVLAGGIWEALITTAAGLTVGIPALIFYNWLEGKVQRIVFEMQVSSVEILDMLLEKERVHGIQNPA
ncbi:MAG: MotA/TolQ/ExbB proton channel family protein [candidate division KSB1 bacterium]|nr:MotA/TolQ/ExbB proton channel family protein [candidate division KSB1 bacterium]